MKTGDDRPTVDLLLSIYRLKERPRTGWQLRGVTNPESVADHSWGTALLCLLYAGGSGLDVDRTVSIALVHDIAESETGDRPARFEPDGRVISDSEKARAERRTIDRLFPESSGDFAAIRELWQEYEERKTPEAVFVRDMNLIDMCLQAYIYESDRSLTLPGYSGKPPAGWLSEFFVTTKRRVTTPFAQALLARIADRYGAIKPSDGPAAGPSEEE